LGNWEGKQIGVQLLSPSEIRTCPIIEAFCFNLKAPHTSRQLLVTSRWHLQTQAIILKKNRWVHLNSRYNIFILRHLPGIAVLSTSSGLNVQMLHLSDHDW